MICFKCGEEDNYVTKTINLEDFIKRYRKCRNCGHNWSTYEIAKDDIDTVQEVFKNLGLINKEEY